NLASAHDRLLRQAFEHLRRSNEHALVVPAPLSLAAVERRATLDRNERILKARTPYVMCVHVAGRDGGYPNRLGQIDERRVSAGVAAHVRTLQLDVERTRKRSGELHRPLRVDDGKPMARTAGKCNEPLCVPLEHLDARRSR